MPMYDFQCDDGHTFEHMCKMAEVDTPTPCAHEGCTKMATQVITKTNLDHGIGCFGDAAKQGRFDENNLSTRYMSSGRSSGRHSGR